MKERRKISRRHLYQYFDTFDIEGNFIGKLADISLSGIQLITDKEMQEDFSLRLNIKFPCELHSDDLLVCAKNVWSRKNNDKFLSGFLFEEVSLESIKTIKEVF